MKDTENDPGITHDIIRFLTKLSPYEMGLIKEIQKRAYEKGADEVIENSPFIEGL